MEVPVQPAQNYFQRNRVFFKGIAIGFLMLIMLIPTAFVNSLVYERKMRQQEIVGEVSSKWATAQRLSGPYLSVPYDHVTLLNDNKTETVKKNFFILPETLDVNGTIEHEIRKRSIYSVLLYKANLKYIGGFAIRLPEGVDSMNIRWKEAKLCFNLSDFRGIEEKIVVNFKGKEYELAPGVPSEYFGTKGLSVPVELSGQDISSIISFGTRMKIKGSEDINFVPLAGNSRFKITSVWPSPSFTGSVVPSDRAVSDSGFTANWKFNKANLPFNTVIVDNNKEADFDFDFGITLLQPTDQYAKTERCTKYAILFIGLTFGLFFIVEITRKKPVHPIQYILVGLALAIFYTLLLSISEFIHFDIAYLISAVAVVTMITLYSRQLFKNNRSSLLTATILTLLYSFIFVLIRLEDTALLVGSIGLFIVLGIVMYSSRKIDWYGTAALEKS
ncbi:MAG: cell envelope integrity protein CreD [Chitinophagaceae bacterium]|nr:cell envelope integrity protein CreD [Chitinophagaceae bacterium]